MKPAVTTKLGYSFQLAAKVLLYASHKQDKHTMAFVIPVVEHWLDHKVVQWVSLMGTDLRWFVHTWTTTAPPNPAYIELISHLTTQCLIDGDWLKMICTYMDTTTAPPYPAYTELTNLSPDNPVFHWWGLT